MKSSNFEGGERPGHREMRISDRQKIILKSVIDAYIQTAEPVGSKALAEKMQLSSATIRNELADLEEMGFLIQPHTSAGRIPTQAGYRFYVDSLMRSYLLSYEETQSIQQVFSHQIRRMEQIIEEAGKLISQLTPYTAVAMTPVASNVSVSRFDLLLLDAMQFVLIALTSLGTVGNVLMRSPVELDEYSMNKLAKLLNERFTNLSIGDISLTTISAFKKELGELAPLADPILDFLMSLCQEAQSCDVFFEGQNNIFNFPEYHDVGRAKDFFDLLSNKDKIVRLMLEPGEDGIRVMIGEENQDERMKDMSVVVSSYRLNDHVRGSIGILGPTRMDYSRAVSHVEYFTVVLNKILSKLYGNEE